MFSIEESRRSFDGERSKFQELDLNDQTIVLESEKSFPEIRN